LVFTEVFDADLGRVLGAVFDEVAEDGLVIVADYEDFLDLWDFGDGAEAVFNNGVSGDVEERLMRVSIGELEVEGRCVYLGYV
jgi:hypothetical protein